MQIEVNGEAREVTDDITVAGLLQQLGLGEALVAVERNAHVVPRAEHQTTKLGPEDRVEVVHFVGGG